MENQFETVFKVGDKVRIVRVPAGCRPLNFVKKNKGVVYTVESVVLFDDGECAYNLDPKVKTHSMTVSTWSITQKDIRHVK